MLVVASGKAIFTDIVVVVITKLVITGSFYNIRLVKEIKSLFLVIYL